MQTTPCSETISWNSGSPDDLTCYIVGESYLLLEITSLLCLGASRFLPSHLISFHLTSSHFISSQRSHHQSQFYCILSQKICKVHQILIALSLFKFALSFLLFTPAFLLFLSFSVLSFIFLPRFFFSPSSPFPAPFSS